MENQIKPCYVKVGGFAGWMKCALCDRYLEDAEMLFFHFGQVHESSSQADLEVPCCSRSLFSTGFSGGEIQTKDNQEASSASVTISGQNPNPTSENCEPFSAAEPRPSTSTASSSSTTTITGGVLRRASKNEEATEKKEEPYVKPCIMTLADLRGRGGRGRGRPAGRGKYKRDVDYTTEASDSDGDSAPVRKRGRPTAAAPKREASTSTWGRGGRRSRPGRKPNDQQNVELSNKPVNSPWETNGHVLQSADADVPAVPGSAEERRTMMAAAAERRLEQVKSRGLQDAEAFRLKKQKQEELDKQREELNKRTFGKGFEAGLRWQI